ncbi:MAG: hypothetical protein KIH65_004930 [Candidatus Uhrbacteria bacterium]|nr:hypothetical protein [Candidatus Uhrbacteria bacterium]
MTQKASTVSIVNMLGGTRWAPDFATDAFKAFSIRTDFEFVVVGAAMTAWILVAKMLNQGLSSPFRDEWEHEELNDVDMAFIVDQLVSRRRDVVYFG